MKILVTSALLVGICGMSWAEDVKEDPQQRSIIITVGKNPFVYGRPISLSVSYRNDAKDSWIVSSPSNSTSVVLYYRPTGSIQRPQGYSFGRIIYVPQKMPDGQVITFFEVPISRRVSIAPGKSYDFKIDLEWGWTKDFGPGLWSVWVVDKNLDIKSNSIDILLRFTADSAAACFEMAIDSNQEMYKRKLHAKWLRKLVPELDLRWPSDDTPKQEREEMEIRIKKDIQAAKEFLADKRNARAVEVAMENINSKGIGGDDSEKEVGKRDGGDVDGLGKKGSQNPEK
jgi:hypothetical protein